MTSAPKKDGRGGPRPGSGRPKSADGVTIAVYLPTRTAEETRRHAADRGESISKYATKALNAMNLEEDRRARKPPVWESAAFFDGYVDMARTEEELDDIASNLETAYVGTEEDRQRLRERIKTKKARIRSKR